MERKIILVKKATVKNEHTANDYNELFFKKKYIEAFSKHQSDVRDNNEEKKNAMQIKDDTIILTIATDSLFLLCKKREKKQFFFCNF